LPPVAPTRQRDSNGCGRKPGERSEPSAAIGKVQWTFPKHHGFGSGRYGVA